MNNIAGPGALKNKDYRFDSFAEGTVVENKKKNHLPAMGWNSWNAFGSGNTEALTKEMVDSIVRLGLDKLGYSYIVLDDGCYLPKRVNGELANEPVKFPNGFKSLSDYIHSKGLKFGMYNDIGTNLCAGAEVGTCGHEYTDAKSYVEWGVDFLKVDNCYYLWDNATFSDAKNARFVYAPVISKAFVKGNDGTVTLNAVTDGTLWGEGAFVIEDGKGIAGIGTFDGTGPDRTPVGYESSELRFEVNTITQGEYKLSVEYKPGEEPACGAWLQVATEQGELCYDGFLNSVSESSDGYLISGDISVNLKAGKNIIRLMNHRRQENTLSSYGKLLEGLNAANPNHDIIYSICEWGKTQPQNWGYKVGDSWRILNDITFQVGRDGDYGVGNWASDYTTGVTSQYNKAVIMDEYAGLDKGWNDPDMMMIGMNGLSGTMCRTHMTMWCMMNSPLMLGLDLRRVRKGDELYNIIANERVIKLNQDALGIQAKRIKIYMDEAVASPDKTYIRNNERVDVLVKPLADGSVAISFINLSDKRKEEGYKVSLDEIRVCLKKEGVNCALEETIAYENLWTGETGIFKDGIVSVDSIDPYDSISFRLSVAK